MPEDVFLRFNGTTFAELVRMCVPALNDLLNQRKFSEEMPLFARAGMSLFQGEGVEANAAAIIDQKSLEGLPERVRKAVEDAVALQVFTETRKGASFAPVFAALLGSVDDLVKALLVQKLKPAMPKEYGKQREWFDPYLHDVDQRMHRHYQETARNLQKTLVYGSGISPLGLLRSVLDHALNDSTKLDGVFAAVKTSMRFSGASDLFLSVKAMNDLRNNSIAHQVQPVTDAKDARSALTQWVVGLRRLWAAACG